MMPTRQKNFYERERTILLAAEQLLLESGCYDLTLDDLAKTLDIAKGTLYKHFDSKDELFLRLLIDYETRLATITTINDSPSATITRMVLQLLLNPRRAMLFTHLEERLSSTSTGLTKQFSELYKIRRERMNALLENAKAYLQSKHSTLSTRDYLSGIWAIGQGGAVLLNSSFYQRYLGRRDTLIASLLTQALTLPLLHTAQTPSTNTPNAQPATPKTAPATTPNTTTQQDDSLSPFGKLSPPTL